MLSQFIFRIFGKYSVQIELCHVSMNTGATSLNVFQGRA